MMQNISVLVTILVISSFTMLYLNAAIKPVVGAKDFRVWLFSWASLTTIAFLSPKLLIAFIVMGAILWVMGKKVENKVALYFAILFVLPGYVVQTVLINLNYQKLSGLTLLLPLFLGYVFGREQDKPPRHMADLFLTLYLLLLFVLQFRGIFIKPGEGFVLTYPAVIKYGFDLFLEFFLPYYVASRYIRNFEQLKKAIAAIVFICILIAPVALFEIGTTRLLYLVIPQNMGFEWAIGEVFRDGMLRATASIEHPLYLGMLMMVGLGLYLFIANYIQSPILKFIGLSIMLLGLLAPLSKGPWTGTALMLFMFYVSGHNKFKNGILIAVAASIFTIVIVNSGYTEKILSLLPFVGNVDTGNVDYRERLFEQSLIVIEDVPWFGMYDPTKHKAMLPLYQGEGIVDIVNLYLGVAMTYGLVGLFLYLAFLATITLGLFKELFIQKNRRSDSFKCGKAFFCILIGLFLVMAVVANAPFLNTILFALCGLIVSYINMLKAERNKPFEKIQQYDTTRVVA